MKKINLSVIAVAISLFCSSQSASALSCQLPAARPEFIEMLSSPPSIKNISEEFEKTKHNCTYTNVAIDSLDPLTKAPSRILARDYSPIGKDRELVRTVILVPPTGGENALDRLYAINFCKAGMRVVLLQHWTGDDIQDAADMGTHDHALTRGTAALKELVDYVAPKNPSQLGIFGTSLGAIGSSLFLGIESRISTGVLVVGGGGLAEVVANSAERSLTKLREERKSLFGFNTLEDYIAALHENMLIEPIDFIRWAKPKKVLSLVATKDKTVLTENQFQLYDAFGRQELRTFNADHVPAILHFGLNENKYVTSYFIKNLSESGSRDQPLPSFDPCSNRRIN